MPFGHHLWSRPARCRAARPRPLAEIALAGIEHVLDFALTATLLAGLRIHFVQRSPEPHRTVSGGQFGGNPSPTFEAQQNLAPTQASLNDMDDAVENSTVVHTPDTPCLGNNY